MILIALILILGFYEVSAKENENITEAFQALASAMQDMMSKRIELGSNNITPDQPRSSYGSPSVSGGTESSARGSLFETDPNQLTPFPRLGWRSLEFHQKQDPRPQREPLRWGHRHAAPLPNALET